MQDLIAKAETLLEALPYIQRFHRARFVIKYGGSFMDSPDPEVRHSVIRDLIFLESVQIDPVVVHGGGKAITRALEREGIGSRFIQGQRVTDEATMRVVDQVLSREINPELVQSLNAFGGNAEGFSGTEIFTCRQYQMCDRDGNAVDLGQVGEVTQVDIGPLVECLQRGHTPVISPTARGEDGRIYNCNADVAAAQVAIALSARRLVFMSDVPGLLSNPTDPSTLIRHLAIQEVGELKRSGVIDSGMIPKVDSAVAALESGVEKVQFVDGRVAHSILLEIFTDEGIGTEVVK